MTMKLSAGLLMMGLFLAVGVSEASSSSTSSLVDCIDEIQDASSNITESCAYNLYMCCWTANDGADGMVNNTDVCRYADRDGVALDFPGDSEGDVHCRGFGWAADADYSTHILPLYFYTKQFDHLDYAGYYGTIEDSPQCGCIEDMPIVTRADCTTFSYDGLTECANNDLLTHYKNRMDAPGGDLNFNLIGTCDNENAVIYEKTGNGSTSSSTVGSSVTAMPTYDEDEMIAKIYNEECEYNTVMCCWSQNDGEGMDDNTDVCYYTGSSRTGLEFPGESEGETHCHGFGWANGTDFMSNMLPLMYYVRQWDHFNYRGYFGSVPGAPECGCIEDMPVVSRADCTTYSSAGMEACANNDLLTHYKNKMGAPGGDLDFNLVGTCDNEDANVYVEYENTEERVEEDTSDEDDAVLEALDLCNYNLYMCCWTENDGPYGMEDNTDVCKVTDYSSASETLEFPGESEGEVHCHGFGWEKDADFYSYMLPLYEYVVTIDHDEYRGYYGNIEGAPMCGCVEDMPVVSRADCTTFSSAGLTACANNNLLGFYNSRLEAFEGDITDINLVKTCDNADETTSTESSSATTATSSLTEDAL